MHQMPLSIPLTKPVAARRTAIVTGGGSGIGRAIAGRLAEDGFDILIIDRDEDAARSAAGELIGEFVATDVSDLKSLAPSRWTPTS